MLGSGILLLIGRGIWWWFTEARKRRIPKSSFPFDVIKPQGDVLSIVYPGRANDPLADQNIPYQKRVDGRNICQELEELLESKRWVLVTGRTGLGKTREAANLAQHLNKEGWTILYLERGEWLDTPAMLDKRIGSDRKLLFFLDDLNKKMYAGGKEHNPEPGSMLSPLSEPLQRRMLRFLTAYEGFCGKVEIRVLATIRNEKTSEYEGEPSEWEKLEFGKYKKFWNKFTRYALPEPEEEAIIQTYSSIVNSAEIRADPKDYPEFASSSDRTFAVIVNNCKAARNENRELNLENFQPTIRGSWEKRYQEVTQKYADANYIYDAIDLLRKTGIDLLPFVVEATAQLIADGNLFERGIHFWKIRIALRTLINKEQILNPADGQIEAKGNPIDVQRNILPTPGPSPLTALILKISKKHPQEILDSLTKFALYLFDNEDYIQALQLNARSIEIYPKNPVTYIFQGINHVFLKEYKVALVDYTHAIELDPKSALAYNNRGTIYGKLQDCNAAMADFNKAIELDPELALAYYNRGLTLAEIQDYPAAVEDYTKAIEINPQYIKAYFVRGLAYENMKNYPAALADYTKTIELDAQDAEAYNNRGNTYSKMRDFTAAMADFSKAIELDPQDARAYNNRGNVFAELQDFPAALEDYSRAIEIDPQYANAYNSRGCSYAELKNFSAALADYSKAIELDPNDDAPVYNTSCLHAQMGEVEKACEWLRKAVLMDRKYLAMAATDKDFNVVREGEIFQRALIEIEEIGSN